MRSWNDCTTKQKIERWEQVIRVLRALTPHQRRKHWNMSFLLEETDCGSVGCAAGHCSLDPWFRRRGFKTVLDAYRPGRWLASNGPDFFGYAGWRSIFENLEQRQVSTVIREIRKYIKEELRAA